MAKASRVAEVEIPPLEESFPFPLTETDKRVLSQTDDEFQLHTWDELKEIVGTHGYLLFPCPIYQRKQIHYSFPSESYSELQGPGREGNLT